MRRNKLRKSPKNATYRKLVSTIRKTLKDLSLFSRRGEVRELRILNTKQRTVSGYFDNPDAMAEAAAEWSGKGTGVFFTLNPVDPDLLAQANNRVKPRAKHTTTDDDILARHWVLLDLDPVRKSGISSTDAEHQLALQRARGVRKTLRAEGFPEPILADSGNGANLLLRVNLPNDDASRVLLGRFLQAIAFRFSDERVNIDTSVANSSRISGVYGTLKRKGDATVDRPHRLSKLIDVPKLIEPVKRILLERLAAQVPDPPKSDSRPSGFNVGHWLEAHAKRLPGIVATAPWKDGGRKWIFNRCPWNREHTNQASYIVQFAGGAIAAGCHHNGCSEKDWHTLRDLVDPGWRETHPTQGLDTPSRENPWAAAQDVHDFLSNYEGTGVDFLEYPTIARGVITEVFSPRGIGKTLWAYTVAIKLARLGYRVLLLDRDNPPQVIHERLRGWGADTLLDEGLLKVMTRDTAPPLTEKEKWSTFPIQDYDLVIIDALDATAEGIGEKESSKPSKALAPLLDIARQKDGPAFLVIGNTVRSGKHSRGSGVIEDRADICFEVRDATGFKPKGRKPLLQEVLEFAPAGAEFWAEQSERRKGRKVYRLVFVPSKFRVGQQPDPFFIELDLRTEPWTMSDVTKDIIKAGETALGEAELQRQAQLNICEGLRFRLHHDMRTVSVNCSRAQPQLRSDFLRCLSCSNELQDLSLTGR